MTTKSPTSTCGAYWGLCLPRSRIAVWLASRPSTTSVASMTCQARTTSPGLGVYVRTALVSSVVVRMAGGIASPKTGDGAARAAPAGSRANRRRYQPEQEAPTDGSGDLAQQPRLDVVDGSAHLGRQQVRALADQPHGFPHVVLGIPERAHRPRWPPTGGFLDQVGEGVVV